MRLHDSLSQIRGPLLGAILLSAIALAPNSSRAQSYHLTDIGLPPGRTLFVPYAINNAGQIAGSSEKVAYRYSNGVFEDLGTLPGGNLSSAAGINSAGQVVGSSQFTNGGAIRHPVRFDQGTVTDLGILPISGNYGLAQSINDLGQIVGFNGPSLSSTNTRAFIWDATKGLRDLGTIGGQYSEAHSINNHGVATGSSQVPTGFGNRHAFIWNEATGMRDIGTLAGDISHGSFINDAGHIVGDSTINDFDNRSHAFLYDGATMHDLGSLGSDVYESDHSAAWAINARDEVVGTTYRSLNGVATQVAFVYRNGRMFDLETLVDNPDYRLYTATGINDAGQIIIDAIKVSTNTRAAVLLTPITAASRKMHGGAIAADVPLPLDGTFAIESRGPGVAGDYEMVVNYPAAIASATAAITRGAGTVSKVTISGSQVIVDLAVNDAQMIQVSVQGTDDSGKAVHLTVPLAVLAGDTNGDGRVNVADTNQTKAHSGEITNAENARFDVNLDGRINVADVNFVKAHAGNAVSLTSPQKLSARRDTLAISSR